MQPYYEPSNKHNDSYLFSRYHIWLRELGYPQLDVIEMETGEWAIIEYLSSTIIPAETKWKLVLGYFEHVEISFSFIRHWVKKLDPLGKLYWADEAEKQRKVDDAWDSAERATEERVNDATKHVMRNPDLVERIAKNGIQELDLLKIRRHIPNYKF